MGKQAIANAARGQVFYVHPNRVTIIGRDTEHRAGEHPLFDERAHRSPDEARVRNIRVYGVKHAVTVRKNGTHATGKFKGEDVLEVIDGRGRAIDCREAYTLAEKAGEEPPLLKIEFLREDEDTQVGVMISLNELRNGDTPMAKAKKAGRIIGMGRSIADVATMFGVTEMGVRQWLALLDLAKPVQKAVERGDIAASAATQLGKLSHEEQEAKLSELIATAPKGKRPTAQKARQHVNGDDALRLTPGAARKILKKHDEWVRELSDDARILLQAFAGEPNAIKRVKGLSAILKG